MLKGGRFWCWTLGLATNCWWRCGCCWRSSCWRATCGCFRCWHCCCDTVSLCRQFPNNLQLHAGGQVRRGNCKVWGDAGAPALCAHTLNCHHIPLERETGQTQPHTPPTHKFAFMHPPRLRFPCSRTRRPVYAAQPPGTPLPPHHACNHIERQRGDQQRHTSKVPTPISSGAPPPLMWRRLLIAAAIR